MCNYKISELKTEQIGSERVGNPNSKATDERCCMLCCSGRYVGRIQHRVRGVFGLLARSLGSTAVCGAVVVVPHLDAQKGG